MAVRSPNRQGTSARFDRSKFAEHSNFEHHTRRYLTSGLHSMPRRPRPTTRKPPAGSSQHIAAPKSAKTKAPKVSSPELSEVDDQDLYSGSEDEEDLEELSDDEDVDVDAPRVAQWVDDDELDEADALSSESEESAPEENQDLGEGPSRINLQRL